MLIWQFKTARFMVEVTAEEESCFDLSWDKGGSVADGIESGEFEVFCAKCAVYFEGKEVASDFLGGCIYENIADFKNNSGINATGCGSYFSDMVKSAISEARLYFKNIPNLRQTID